MSLSVDGGVNQLTTLTFAFSPDTPALLGGCSVSRLTLVHTPYASSRPRGRHLSTAVIFSLILFVLEGLTVFGFCLFVSFSFL